MKGEDRKHESPQPVQGLLRRLVRAPGAWAMVWPAALVIGGYIAWHRWGAEHVSKRYYGIDPALIHVTARPEYISTDIARAVYSDTRLDQLSLLDPAAAARIASAFSFHPWVRRVVAVRKLPGGEVDVHLQYRRPVAMVFVISRHPEIKGRSFFAVDEDGVLLPPTEFSRDETMKYLHIEVPDVYPTGGIGSSFGDNRVTGAAKVAAVLEPFRDQLKLRSIRMAESSRTAPVPQYELFTVDGRNLFWGSAPGEEMYGEPASDVKLRQWLERTDQNTDLAKKRTTGEPTGAIGRASRH
ncbi:MAG: hypothetical protein ACO1RT_10055 [Planctomycetaceae bacterium]